jgi:aminoglycoside 3-N-acetyltransferase I
MIRILRVRQADAESATTALKSIYHRSPAEGARMATMLDDPGFLLLLAEFDRSTVGYLYGQFLDRLDGTRLLLIYDITVDAGHRRKGVGTALMRSAFTHAHDAGATGCWLVAARENAGVRAFYGHLDGAEWPAVGFRWELG